MVERILTRKLKKDVPRRGGWKAHFFRVIETDEGPKYELDVTHYYGHSGMQEIDAEEAEEFLREFEEPMQELAAVETCS